MHNVGRRENGKERGEKIMEREESDGRRSKNK
jgi:hypothetical protein